MKRTVKCHITSPPLQTLSHSDISTNRKKHIELKAASTSLQPCNPRCRLPHNQSLSTVRTRVTHKNAGTSPRAQRAAHKRARRNWNKAVIHQYHVTLR